jgi:hypothetical protein
MFGTPNNMRYGEDKVKGNVVGSGTTPTGITGVRCSFPNPALLDVVRAGEELVLAGGEDLVQLVVEGFPKVGVMALVSPAKPVACARH